MVPTCMRAGASSGSAAKPPSKSDVTGTSESACLSRSCFLNHLVRRDPPIEKGKPPREFLEGAGYGALDSSFSDHSRQRPLLPKQGSKPTAQRPRLGSRIPTAPAPKSG